MHKTRRASLFPQNCFFSRAFDAPGDVWAAVAKHGVRATPSAEGAIEIDRPVEFVDCHRPTLSPAQEASCLLPIVLRPSSKPTTANSIAQESTAAGAVVTPKRPLLGGHTHHHPRIHGSGSRVGVGGFVSECVRHGTPPIARRGERGGARRREIDHREVIAAGALELRVPQKVGQRRRFRDRAAVAKGRSSVAQSGLRGTLVGTLASGRIPSCLCCCLEGPSVGMVASCITERGHTSWFPGIPMARKGIPGGGGGGPTIRLVPGPGWVRGRAGAAGRNDFVDSSLEIAVETIVVIVLGVAFPAIVLVVVADLGGRASRKRASLPMVKEGIELSAEVFGVFVGNELLFLQPEPPLAVFDVVVDFVLVPFFADFGGAIASANPAGSLLRNLVLAVIAKRQEIGRKDDGLDEMVLLLLLGVGASSFHGARSVCSSFRWSRKICVDVFVSCGVVW